MCILQNTTRLLYLVTATPLIYTAPAIPEMWSFMFSKQSNGITKNKEIVIIIFLLEIVMVFKEWEHINKNISLHRLHT